MNDDGHTTSGIALDTPGDGVATGAGPSAAARYEDVDLDVRVLPHAQRHSTIFQLLPRLAEGQALVLVVDHDPLPLRYQLDALHPGVYAWEYVEQGPREWRVAVRRLAHGG